MRLYPWFLWHVHWIVCKASFKGRGIRLLQVNFCQLGRVFNMVFNQLQIEDVDIF